MSVEGITEMSVKVQQTLDPSKLQILYNLELYPHAPKLNDIIFGNNIMICVDLNLLICTLPLQYLKASQKMQSSNVVM
jgi:hypothetical protein